MAFTFSSSCASERAPKMHEETWGCASSQASDTATGVAPVSAATARTASRILQLRSLLNPAIRSFHFSRRAPAGGGWSLSYFPVRKPARERRPAEDAQALRAAERQVLALELADDQAVLRLQRHERRQVPGAATHSESIRR